MIEPVCNVDSCYGNFCIYYFRLFIDKYAMSFYVVNGIVSLKTPHLPALQVESETCNSWCLCRFSVKEIPHRSVHVNGNTVTSLYRYLMPEEIQLHFYTDTWCLRKYSYITIQIPEEIQLHLYTDTWCLSIYKCTNVENYFRINSPWS